MASVYFDLGLILLRIMETRKRIEALLDTEIDATALLNQPTVGEPVSHLNSSLSDSTRFVR